MLWKEREREGKALNSFLLLDVIMNLEWNF